MNLRTIPHLAETFGVAVGLSDHTLGSAAAVAAVVLGAMIWTQHRADVDELRHRAQAMQAAADWTNVLINMNKDTVEASMVTLHEGTVGKLNADFDASIEPYRKLVQTLKARTTGQVDSVAVESIHHDERPNPGPPPQMQPELTASASRTDTVMVVATSISENAGGDKPQTVRWNLRLDVSDVDGKLLISRLEPIR